MRMGKMKRNPEAVAECIREAGTIAVAGHVNPDGDTLGSAAAMYLALRTMGKEVSLFCDDKIPDQLSFLPGAELFRIPKGDEGPFDLLLAVDVSDIGRLGSCAGLISRSRKTAQIDHHPTNPMYMQVNSVDGKSPATCMLIMEQLDTLGIPLTREIAICLYTGISTDLFLQACESHKDKEYISDVLCEGTTLSYRETGIDVSFDKLISALKFSCYTLNHGLEPFEEMLFEE